jgi:hypothetical protein
MVVTLLDLPKYIRRTGTALPAVTPLGRRSRRSNFIPIIQRPMTRSPSFDGFVDRFSRFSFPPPDYPSYRGPDFYPGGTTSD